MLKFCYAYGLRLRASALILAWCPTFAFAGVQAPEQGLGSNLQDTQLVNQLLDSAFNAYVEKDYQSAMVNFQKALEISPKDEAALKGLQQCRKKLGKQIQ